MNILKRISFAVDAFRGVDSGKLYSSLVQENFQFLGGFNFIEGSDNLYLNDGYAKNSDVYSIVRKVAMTASYVDWGLFNQTQDGDEIIEDGELFDLIRCPNRLQTRQEYTEEALTYLLLLGNSYTAGTKALGMGDVIREFANLPSNETSIIVGNSIDPIRGYLVEGVNNVSFESDEVFHIRYPNPSGVGEQRLYGMSPLKAGNALMQTGNNQQEASASILKNKGTSGILTSDSDRSLKPEEAEKIQESWKAKQDPKLFGQILATSAKLRYLQLGMSPTDLKIIENQVITLRQLCSLYSVDSSLFNDPANKTFNNRKEATKALYTEAVLPNLSLLLSNMNAWLLPGWSKKDNKDYIIKPNTSKIEALQVDQKEEAKKDKIIADTVINILTSAISNESKVQSLIYSIGMSEEEAQLIVGNENNTE